MEKIWKLTYLISGWKSAQCTSSTGSVEVRVSPMSESFHSLWFHWKSSQCRIFTISKCFRIYKQNRINELKCNLVVFLKFFYALILCQTLHTWNILIKTHKKRNDHLFSHMFNILWWRFRIYQPIPLAQRESKDLWLQTFPMRQLGVF